jgi:hypothetical protein
MDEMGTFWFLMPGTLPADTWRALEKTRMSPFSCIACLPADPVDHGTHGVPHPPYIESGTAEVSAMLL